MLTENPCPTTQDLEQWQLGLNVLGADEIERHVAACDHCADRLRAFRGEDAVVAAMRRARPERQVTAEADILIPWLKRLCMPDETRTFASKKVLSPADAEPGLPSYDFLAPAQTPGDMGSLGPYRIVRLLGAGGMGLVFEAEDPKLCRRVALKVIRPELFRREGSRERFLREAQTIASLEHDQVVAIHQVEEANGVPFLTMPLLQGESLEVYLTRVDGPTPLPELLRIGREIASGLAAAHALELVHRDIKPSNIWLQRELPAGAAIPAEVDVPVSRVKILDFGLAQSTRSESIGEIAGTPAYMSPEQCKGTVVDARSDLFSLGCILYRMATGKHPFRKGADMLVTLWQLAVENPPPARSLNPKIPRALSKLIERMLAKRAEDRPESAQTVAESLAAIERSLKPRWPAFVGSALAAAALALAFAAWWHAPPAPVPITIDYDEPPRRIAISREGKETRVVDLNEQATWPLRPGLYQVKVESPIEGRRIEPSMFVVTPNAPAKLTHRLVGEIRKEHHSLAVTDVAFSPIAGSTLAVSSGKDRRVGLWNTDQEKAAFLEGHESPVRCAAISPDGKRAATGSGMPSRKSENAVRLWDLETRRMLNQPLLHARWVATVAFAPRKNQLLAGLNDGTAVLWDLDRLEIVQTLQGHDQQGIARVAFRPDGAAAFTAGRDGKILLWELSTAKILRRFEGHPDGVTSIAVDPKGEKIVSCSWDGTLRSWDANTGVGTVRATLAKALHAVAWSPDGRRWLTGGDDGVVRLWNAADGAEICAFVGHRGPVHGVAFSADSRRALSGGGDGSVRLWELPP